MGCLAYVVFSEGSNDAKSDTNHTQNKSSSSLEGSLS
jgi:hypothetical protein